MSDSDFVEITVKSTEIFGVYMQNYGEPQSTKVTRWYWVLRVVQDGREQEITDTHRRGGLGGELFRPHEKPKEALACARDVVRSRFGSIADVREVVPA